MVVKNYSTMGTRVRALMISAGALKDNFLKGNNLPQGMNGSHINDIQTLSSQLYDDFKGVKADYDNGQINLQTYLAHLNVFTGLLDMNVTLDEERFGAEEIKAEHQRMKKVLEPRTDPAKASGSTKPTTVIKGNVGAAINKPVTNHSFSEALKVFDALLDKRK